jgi:hypothetical protein
MLGFEITLEPSAKERLTVLLAPGGAPAKLPEVRPLSEW